MIHWIVFSLLISFVMGSSPSLNLTQSIALLVENTLTSTLSLISTLFVAYSMVYLRLLSKGISNQMIFSTLFILQTSQMVADNTCKFFASVLQFTDLSQCFWILAIGGHIVQLKRIILFVQILFVWGTSLVLSIIPVNNYGKKVIFGVLQ
ncbi:hypothetical protein ENUP19_0130G0033 [Entamoeba nuttalli]|uniref:Uncharacterized protein n=1 Tax=Entamoeba nuttalli TaxID=412467 RepID=A0ABQ0DJR4_9EUKA